jgi:hypothetical protein
MAELNHLFANNRNWVVKMATTYPGFFEKLSQQALAYEPASR